MQLVFRSIESILIAILIRLRFISCAAAFPIERSGAEWLTARPPPLPHRYTATAMLILPPRHLRLLLWLLLWLLRFSHGRRGLACRCHAAGAGRHSRQAHYCQPATLAALPPHPPHPLLPRRRYPTSAASAARSQTAPAPKPQVNGPRTPLSSNPRVHGRHTGTRRDGSPAAV